MINIEKLTDTILSPHISEKSKKISGGLSQFVFKVNKSSNKIDIKNAIELIFKTKVKTVSCCNVKGKSKVFKQKPGKRSNWKKAYIVLKKDSDINFADFTDK